MALATQCPHCQTTFRVAHDQLKLRAGLVRCGACKQIFNGIENLLPPEEPKSAEPQVPSPPEPQVPVETSAPEPAPEFLPPSAPPATDDDDPSLQINIADELPPDDELQLLPEPPKGDNPFDVFGPAVTSEPAPSEDPLLRMTLIDVAPQLEQQKEIAVSPAQEEEETKRLAQTIEALQDKPLRSATAEDEQADELDRVEAEEFDEPTFVRQGRRRQRLGRALRTFMAVCSGALLVTLAAQAAYVFRDQLAASFPQAQPVLSELCERLECQLGLPAQIESVSIESNELQSIDANSNSLALSVLLRNRSATVQAWPHIELTLNDTNEQPIVRKVFQPRDYLASTQDISKGFAPKSEQPLKIHFTLAQLKASGYRVYLFYP